MEIQSKTLQSQKGDKGQVARNLQDDLRAYGPFGDYHKKVTAKPVNNYDINPIAEFTSVVDLTYMITSIKTNGQYNPILLWYNNKTRRYECVDGRHRLWACNILGIEVLTTKLDKTVQLQDLPALILDIQLTQQKVPNKNASSAIIIRYLAKYGNKGKGITAKAIRLQYPNMLLTEKDMTAMKYLHTNMPLWFAKLELGKGVAPEGTYQKLTSPRALQKIAKKMYIEAKEGQEIVETTSTDKELTKLFTTVKALINTIDITSPETGSKLSYVLSQLAISTAIEYPTISVDDYEPPETYGELL